MAPSPAPAADRIATGMGAAAASVTGAVGGAADRVQETVGSAAGAAGAAARGAADALTP